MSRNNHTALSLSEEQQTGQLMTGLPFFRFYHLFCCISLIYCIEGKRGGLWSGACESLFHHEKGYLNILLKPGNPGTQWLCEHLRVNIRFDSGWFWTRFVSVLFLTCPCSLPHDWNVLRGTPTGGTVEFSLYSYKHYSIIEFLFQYKVKNTRSF